MNEQRLTYPIACREFPIRVELSKPAGFGITDAVNVQALEVDVAEYGLQTQYKSFDSLPQWVQTNIIKLQMLPSPPPMLEISQTGMRITDTVFWIATAPDGAPESA